MSRSFQRVGHGGASALAPGNTLASFDAAVAVGIDMIEFDVRRWRGELVLAHTLLDAQRGASVGLPEALAHLGGPRFTNVELNVDLKRVGGEAEVLSALRHAGLLERTLLSSQVPVVIGRLRELEPRARTGISVGSRIARLSRGWKDWRGQVLGGLADHRWDAVMAQHGLIDAALLRDVIERDGRLYAWTVNQRRSIKALRAMGVHGVVTADPRLFADE